MAAFFLLKLLLMHTFVGYLLINFNQLIIIRYETVAY